MDFLPPETILHICSFMRNSDIFRLRITCKYLNEIIPQPKLTKDDIIRSNFPFLLGNMDKTEIAELCGKYGNYHIMRKINPNSIQVRRYIEALVEYNQYNTLRHDFPLFNNLPRYTIIRKMIQGNTPLCKFISIVGYGPHKFTFYDLKCAIHNTLSMIKYIIRYLIKEININDMVMLLADVSKNSDVKASKAIEACLYIINKYIDPESISPSIQEQISWLVESFLDG